MNREVHVLVLREAGGATPPADSPAMRAAEDGQNSRTNSTTPGFDAIGVRCMVELKGNKALEAARVDSHGFGSLE